MYGHAPTAPPALGLSDAKPSCEFDQILVVRLYNQRSRVETLLGRWKMVIGPKLKARSFPNQKTQAKIGTHILNKMIRLGRAKFEAVT